MYTDPVRFDFASDLHALVVGDIGNTYARFARVTVVPGPLSDTTWPEVGDLTACEFAPQVRVRTPELNRERFHRVIEELAAEHALWRVASVHRGAAELLAGWQWPPGERSRIHLVTYCDFPMPMAVEQPARVGVDRLAAAWAARRSKDAGRAAVVIDAGTAITVDAVAVDGTFLGGTIAPGMGISLQALARQTSQLPLIEDLSAARGQPVIGRNTEQAIARGVWWGCVGAVRELAERTWRELGSDAEIFVTGGDGPHLAACLPWATRVVPELVWQGLLP